MNEKAFIQERVKALEESVEFFSNRKKQERERWDCSKFLTTLRVPFNEADISSSAPEPADVVYLSDAFQIKEILDPGRRRKDEYEEQLAKARAAVRPDELFTLFSPKDLTSAEVCSLVFERVRKLDMKYAPADRSKTNLLFYVNLKHRFFKRGPLPDLACLTAYGWRSINVLLNSGAMVLCAAPDAPSYLTDNAGMFVPGNFS